MPIYRYGCVPATVFSRGFHLGTVIERSAVQDLSDAAEVFCRLRWTYSFALTSAYSGSSATLRFVLPALYAGWGQFRINGGYSTASGGTCGLRDWLDDSEKSGRVAINYSISASYWPSSTDALSPWWVTVSAWPLQPEERPSWWELTLEGVSFTGPWGMTVYQPPQIAADSKVYVGYQSATLRPIPALGALSSSQYGYDAGVLRQIEKMIWAATKSPLIIGAVPAVFIVSGPGVGVDYWGDDYVVQACSRWIPRSQLLYDDDCALWVAVDGDPSVPLVVHVGNYAVNVRNSYRWTEAVTAGKHWYIVPLPAQLVLNNLSSELIYCTVEASKISQLSIWIAGYPGPDDVD